VNYDKSVANLKENELIADRYVIGNKVSFRLITHLLNPVFQKGHIPRFDDILDLFNHAFNNEDKECRIT
jgi:hypothetical protein